MLQTSFGFGYSLPHQSKVRQPEGRRQNMKSVVLTSYGDPATGLGHRELSEPEKPGIGQVLVGIEFSPLNFTDILVAPGLYPLRPALPSVIGNEGVGRVLEIAEIVVELRDGDGGVLSM